MVRKGKARGRSRSGQASVEFLLVGLVLFAFIAGVAALWRYAANGGFSGLATGSGSHALNGAGGLVDALLF